MSSDEKTPDPVDLVAKKNRKQRRFEAKLARQNKKDHRSYYYWHRRILNEMKENSEIQTKVVEGKFDYFLGNPVVAEQA